MADKKITVQDILDQKSKGEKITMITAYDYPSAVLVDRAGAEIALVGDSLANVVLGLESTTEIGMPEMLHHARAVRRGVEQALLIGDMPFGSYGDPETAVTNARRFVDEAGCEGVKLEWFENCSEVIRAIVEAGIPVMSHIGLTPQTADKLGGFKVQGKDADSARTLIRQARTLEEAGCFSVVLECIPDEIARVITAELGVPTIGIGAGVHCDGQVLVFHDLLGLFERYRPKFVKQYADLNPVILQALREFREEVRNGKFPAREHTFTISKEQIRQLRPER